MTINGIPCKVLEKQGKKATIEIDGQKIIIASDLLPERVMAGSLIKLFFLNPEEASIQEKKLAKSILEQILNGN